MRTPTPLFRLSAAAAAALLLAACADDPLPTQTAPTEQALAPAPPAPAAAAAACTEGTLPGGALFRICVPDGWGAADGLVVYAPGYQSAREPLRIRDDDVVEGSSVGELVTGLGFGYATTSFRENGLVVPETWIGGDLRQLVERFAALHGAPRHTFLVGASQGGLITALSLERLPRVGGAGLFDGGVAACGPYGDFQRQLDYLGDFRVVYDVLFGPRIPGWSRWTQPPGTVDPALIEGWDALVPAIRAAALADPGRTLQLVRATGAPVDPSDLPGTAPATVEGVLWYHVFGTDDANAKLGGNPYDNRGRWYSGSADDRALNAAVARFAADPAARARVAGAYQTTGRLVRPLVTLHTLADPIVPVFHQRLYRQKVGLSPLHTGIPVPRYGHCAFEVEEVLAAFAVMVLKATAQEMVVPASALPEPAAQQAFLRLAREHGANPRIAR